MTPRASRLYPEPMRSLITLLTVLFLVAAAWILMGEDESSLPVAAGPREEVEDEPIHEPPDSQSSQQFTQYTQEPLSQFRGSRMSSRVRAHAFITLGL